MSLPQSIQDITTNKINTLVSFVERKKIEQGYFHRQVRQTDGQLEVLINTQTDKDGNLGYCIALFYNDGVDEYQYIHNVHSEIDLNRSWFKVVNPRN